MGKGGEHQQKHGKETEPGLVDLAYLAGPALDQFEFFERAVPYLREASDADLAECVRRYAEHVRPGGLEPPDVAATDDFRVEMMWRFHCLCPAAYAKDFGSVVKHEPTAASDLLLPAVAVMGKGEEKTATSCSWPAYDLVAAARRQIPFMEKMLKLRGKIGHMDKMRAGVGLYRKFLLLIKEHPPPKAPVMVPTLLIDLIWHTHQLFPSRYRDEATRIAGRFVNHDDTIDEDELATDLATTEMLWKTAYAEPYLGFEGQEPLGQWRLGGSGGRASSVGTAVMLCLALVGTMVVTGGDGSLADSHRHRQLEGDAMAYVGHEGNTTSDFSAARRQLGNCDATEYYITDYQNTYEIDDSSAVTVTMQLTYNLRPGESCTKDSGFKSIGLAWQSVTGLTVSGDGRLVETFEENGYFFVKYLFYEALSSSAPSATLRVTYSLNSPLCLKLQPDSSIVLQLTELTTDIWRAPVNGAEYRVCLDYTPEETPVSVGLTGSEVTWTTSAGVEVACYEWRHSAPRPFTVQIQEPTGNTRPGLGRSCESFGAGLVAGPGVEGVLDDDDTPWWHYLLYTIGGCCVLGAVAASPKGKGGGSSSSSSSSGGCGGGGGGCGGGGGGCGGGGGGCGG